MEKDKRNTNIELLRILCIFGITAHHMVYHSTVMEEPLGVSRLFAQFLILFGKSGVNIFVLISGYFLVGTTCENHKTARRVVNLWKQVILYSILFGGVFIVLSRDVPNMTKLAKMFFPTITGAYWFMTAFIGLMFLVPFLNYFAQSMSRELYKKLIITLIILFVLPPQNTWSSDLIWFIAVYLTAGYLRFHPLKYLTTQKRCAIVGIGCFAAMWLASIVLSLLALKVSAINPYINYFAFRQNSPFMFLGCIAVFLFVLGLKSHYMDWVNKFARHVLPCYLIQSNVFFSGKLWAAVDNFVPKGVIYPLMAMGIVCTLCFCFVLFDIALTFMIIFLKKGFSRLRKRHS